MGLLVDYLAYQSYASLCPEVGVTEIGSNLNDGQKGVGKDKVRAGNNNLDLAFSLTSTENYPNPKHCKKLSPLNPRLVSLGEGLHHVMCNSPSYVQFWSTKRTVTDARAPPLTDDHHSGPADTIHGAHDWAYTIDFPTSTKLTMAAHGAAL